jgi:hypothetical protein
MTSLLRNSWNQIVEVRVDLGEPQLVLVELEDQVAMVESSLIRPEETILEADTNPEH